MDVQQPDEKSSTRRERRDARANREQLLAAAKRLFAAQGVGATTMQEVARAAGVGQGTLYRHFADKGELCMALIREDLAAFQERVGPLIAPRSDLPSPLARLELLIIEKNRLTESHLALLIAMEEAATAPRRPKPFRGPFQTWLHAQISSLLTDAITQGEAANIEVTLTADAIVAASAPQLFAFQRREGGYTVEQISAAMCRLFVDGLRRTAQ